MDRETFLALELGSREALRSICEGGYEEPLATPEDGLAGLLPELAEALEGAIVVVDSFLEVECHTLFTAVVTHVFSRL